MDREPEPVYGRELSAKRVSELGQDALERFQRWGREMFRLQMQNSQRPAGERSSLTAPPAIRR